MNPYPAKGRKRLIVIVAAIVILGLMLAGIFLFGPKSKGSGGAKRVSDTFIKEIVAGQADESYQLFSSSSKAYTTSDSWKATVSRLKTSFTGDAADIETVQPKTTEKIEVHTFKYRITGTDNGNYILSVYITNADGPWHVLQFNSTKETTVK